MTATLWFFVAGGVVVICLVVCDAIARKAQVDRYRAMKAAEDRTAYLTVKQRAMGKRLRRQKKSLLSGKDYTPTLTKKAEAPEPAPVAQVYAIKGGKR